MNNLTKRSKNFVSGWSTLLPLKGVLLVTVILLSSLNASAQLVYSKTQNFSGSAPTATTYVTQTTAANASNSGSAGYFATNFTQPGIGAFGSQDPNASSVPNLIPVVFATQVFAKNSTNNKLTFKLGQNGGSGFSGANKVDVIISLNGAAAVTALRIVGPPDTGNDKGPQFAIGTGGSSLTAYESPQTVTMGLATNQNPSATAIGDYTITLPNFLVRTSVSVTISITASKRSTVLIDDVTISSGSPLPVELTRFDATTKGQNVNVAWATASEKNNDHFDVQRSNTGAAFETIGSVKGQGTSTTAHAYAFVDSRPLAGLSYYRLRQVDADGSSSYSPIATVQLLAGLKAVAYPNPSVGTVTLPALDGPIHYRLFNNLGQTLLSGQVRGNEQLDLTAVPKGSFFLELTSTSGRTTQRLVRE